MTTYEDEIDFRPYLRALLRYWWHILLVAAILAVPAFIYTQMQPPMFKATASILLNHNRAQLALAQQFPTVSDPVDQRSRQDALMTLIDSDSLASEVRHLLGDELAEENLNGLVSFKSRVSLETKGDVILVAAEAKSPAVAAEIANTWARQAVEKINQAYTEGQPLAEIQLQLASAQDGYNVRQTELETFIQNNNIAQLEQQLNQAKTLLMVASRNSDQKAVYYADRQVSMAALATQAEALQEQIQSGNASAAGRTGDAIAVLMMRARAFGIVANTNSVFTPQQNTSGSGSSALDSSLVTQVQPDPLVMNISVTDVVGLEDTTANYVRDLAGIAEQARVEEQRAQDQLLAMLQGTDEPNESLKVAAVKVQTLEAQLEAENAQLNTLTSQRNLAWQAYQALMQKETEIKTGSGTTNYMTLAIQAVAPENAEGRGTVRNTLIAGVLGGMLAVFWILGMEWWRSENITKQPIEQQPAAESMD